jgi:hypothetical protein
MATGVWLGRVRTQAECIQLGMQDSQPVVYVDCQDDAPEIVASHVLMATGRTPNTDDLGLEAAGIERDKNGYIPVNARLQTAVPGVWAMGDCNGRGAFTHTSYNDYEIVAANLLDGGSRSVDDRIPCHAVYIDPPLAQVGMNEREVRERGRTALIGIRPMTKVGRAVEKGESDGFMKVLADAETKEILGATILGTGGDEAIHCILTAMYARKPVSLLQHSMHIHPTVAELMCSIAAPKLSVDNAARPHRMEPCDAALRPKANPDRGILADFRRWPATVRRAPAWRRECGFVRRGLAGGQPCGAPQGQELQLLPTSDEDCQERESVWSLLLLRFQRSHIDREAILNIGFEESFVRLIDLLDGDDFHIGSDVVLPAEVQHLLRFSEAANG